MNLVDLEDEYGFFVCLGFFVCFVLFIGFSRQGFFVALETVLELALWAGLASNHCPAVCFYLYSGYPFFTFILLFILSVTFLFLDKIYTAKLLS